MRQRIDDLLVIPVCQTTNTLCSGSTTTTNRYPSLAKQGTYRETHDTVIANFHKLSAAGRVFNSPFIGKRLELSASCGKQSATRIASCTGSSTKSQTWDSYFSVLEPSWTPSLCAYDADEVARDATDAYTSAIASIGEPDVQGATNFAELPKTISSLAGLQKSFLSFLMRAQADWNQVKSQRGKKKHLKFKDAGTLSSFIAGNWLLYRFAVLPLVRDTAEVVSQIKGKPYPQRVTSRQVRHRAYADVVTSTYSGSHFRCNVTQHRSVEIEIRAGIMAQVHTATVIQRNGLSLASMPSAAWELVPWSFVADWFVNIGDLISIISPSVGYDEKASWTTHVFTHETSWKVEYTGLLTSTWNYSTPSDNGLYKQTFRVRNPGGNVGFTFKQVDLDSRMWRSRLIDAGALIMQRLS